MNALSLRVRPLFLAALLLCLAALLYGVSSAAAQEPVVFPEPVPLSDDPFIEYAPATVLVKVSGGVAIQSGVNAASGEATVAVAGDAPMLAASLLAFGATSAQPLYAQPEVSAASVAETTYRVTLRADADVPMAAQAMATDPAVLYAEPDYIARAALTPNDPELTQQWALARIGAPAAWDLTTGSPDVIIAFIDSGVDTVHEEFAGRLWVNDDPAGGGDNDSNGFVDDLNGWNFVAKSANIADSSGHGTLVAGVAGAASNNAKGIAGLCWQCRLMIVTAMQPSGAANYSDIAEAVKYASSNGAHVINISLGGYADSQVLRDAIAEASVTALVVAGAGNDDSASPFYPAAYTQVLAVAATDLDDKKPVFSNYGPWVDVSAPGAAIRTPTLGANAYVDGVGTSLSTAFVSGLAGLLKSRNPGWTPEQVRWQIVNTAASVDAANPTYAGQLGTGRINAQAALANSPQPRLELTAYALDGVAAARPAPGQSFQLVVTLKNTWLPASNLNATLTSADPYVSIPDAAGAFGSLPSGQTGSNSADPFGVTLAGNTPYSRNLAFTLNLTGSGGFAASVPLAVQVRSSIQNVQGTISGNVTWTNDKIYVITNNIGVAAGSTLTIQPGTTVRFNGDFTFTIAGTLIARGTTEQKIRFEQVGAGTITFTDTSQDAVFDSGGAYVAGSIMQHVVAVIAYIGGDLASPYVADNQIDGALLRFYSTRMRIERNQLSDSSIEISSQSGGGIPHPTPIPTQASALDGIASDSPSGFLVVSDNALKGGSLRVFGGDSTTVVSDNSVLEAAGTAIEVDGGTVARNRVEGAQFGLVVCVSPGNSVHHNLVSRTTYIGIRAGECGNEIHHNTVVPTSGAAVEDGGGLLHNNNLIAAPGGYALRLYSANVDATQNWWGTADPAAIQQKIYDGNDEFGLGVVDESSPLAGPEQDAPAFVTSITMSPNPVGLQRGTLTVNFSRPMDTSIAPSISFHDARRGTSEVVLPNKGQIAGTRDVLGRLWFLSPGTSVHMYDGVTWTDYSLDSLGVSGPFEGLFAGRNGDVWALGAGGPVRFRAGLWSLVPGAPSLAGTEMAEDMEGRLFFLHDTSVYRYDGTDWAKVFEGSIPLKHITVSGDGRTWIVSGTNPERLYTLDAGSLNERTSELGVASSEAIVIMTDTLGRLWVAFEGQYGLPELHVRSGGLWEEVTVVPTGSAPEVNLDNVRDLVEDDSERIWILGEWRVYVCDTIKCSYRDTGLELWQLVIDSYTNLWGPTNDGVRMLPEGHDYKTDPGSWISSTRWVASFQFSPQVPRAPYTVRLDGTVGADGIPSAPAAPYTFTVDYAGGVTTLPPLPPTVQAVATASLTSLSASWAPNGAGITQYRYAIGTTPGARNVVGWTYTTATSVTHTGLNLTSGQTYYVTVQARNAAGLWSVNGVSNAVVAGTPTTRTMSVTKTGAGTITSAPAGINCGTDCGENFAYGTTVTLSATPAMGSTFTEWGGACSGAGACQVSMTEARNVSAGFAAQQLNVTVPTAGAANGSVIVEVLPAGEIDAAVVEAASPDAPYPYGTRLRLTAIPNSGYVFTGWTGSVNGNQNPTIVTVTGAMNIGAMFVALPVNGPKIFLPTVKR